MVSLKSILKPEEIVKVPFGDVTVNVYFRPQYLTPEFEDNLKSLQKEEEATEAFLDLFVGAISRWDLSLDEGPDVEAIPIQKDKLRKVPYEILGEVLNAVQEASVPNSTTDPNLDSTSRLEGGSAPFQSGTP